MKIALIAGGRDYIPTKEAFEWLKNILVNNNIEKILSGHARGADKFGEEVAKSLKLEIELFIPEWDKHGKSAGFKRNQEMIDQNPNVVILFPGGNGTAHTKSLAIKNNIPIIEYEG